ncbi:MULTISPECIES: glycosidase [Anaerolinea]|jgi:predicted GH43/DUF377 family glycosyl hydrolase|uniref:glycoside hydrolase family 130 protein n=1 Tax=Anaerolinea TaxID=233189 RepID=UPI002637DBB4|nr:glycosidase [Anaerolinea thermophila]
MKLNRYPKPVLLPDPQSPWECYNVFNPGVLYANGLFHMIYRAQGLDWVSRLGYAISTDGIHWNRLKDPIMAPESPEESRGLEDPRIVEIEGTYYMTYTAYGSVFRGSGQPTHAGGGILPMVARSHNLITWERLGPIVVGEDNKDHVLFPRKIGGKFVALHRRWPQVWLAYSDDLIHWPPEQMAPIYGPRAENLWESRSVGNNGVPIETEYGWVVLNHAYDENKVYKIGVVLLDLDNPTKVIHRPKDPIFWPEELWELRGDVPNVVFSCANPVVNETVYVFYGGGDHVIGLATCPLSELIDYARFG